MAKQENAQTPAKRQIVELLDREFARLHARLCALVGATPHERLYRTVAAKSNQSVGSIGESVLRSAAAIEQTFGGITANLWDDPFEWTLPEQLSSPVKVIEHLADVEATRTRAFSSFTADECLLKQVATPSGAAKPLIELLLETLVRANNHESRAHTLKILSDL